MDNSGNWFTRYTRVMIAILSLYPWLIILLAFLDVGHKPAGGFFSAGAALALTLTLTLTLTGLSFINLIISIIFIVLANIYITDTKRGTAGYFFAINSISLLWMIFPIFSL